MAIEGDSIALSLEEFYLENTSYDLRLSTIRKYPKAAQAGSMFPWAASP